MLQSDWTAVDAILRSVLASHGGVAPIAAFLLAGLTRHQVAARFRCGVIERPRIGWYVDPLIPWQGKQAVRVGGVAACISAAPSWGLPTPPSAQRIRHVSVEENAGRFRHHKDRTWRVAAGDDGLVHMHWGRRLDTAVGWRTGLVDTLLHLGDCVPLEWFVAALDAALHRPRGGEPVLNEADYARLVRALPRRLLGAIDLVDARAESPLETLLRLALVRHGIGPFDLQFWPDPRHRVDLIVCGKLILEADGEEFHDPAADALRDALFRSMGYEVLRFDYNRIVFDIDGVIADIRTALAAV